MIAAIVIGIIAALSLYFVLEPILLNIAAKSPQTRGLKNIEIHYKEAIRELEYELQSGKIDEEEFERLKEELKNQMGINSEQADP